MQAKSVPSLACPEPGNSNRSVTQPHVSLAMAALATVSLATVFLAGRPGLWQALA
jgi:hypothetical protein